MSNSGFSFPFNNDITDCFLMTLLDFQSLQAFILSSKFVYSVFRSRQNSILSATAHRQFGSVLPLAMRLVHYFDDIHSSGLAQEVRWEAGAQDFTITPAQARLLRDNAATVQVLEDIYSWREKDPRSRTSRLSCAESLRFQQSVYRFWLLAAAYGPGALENKRFEYSDGNPSKLRDSIIIKETSYLLGLGRTELMGVNELHSFLLDLAKWALIKHTTSSTGSRLGVDDRDDVYLVWGGPAVTLDALRGNWPYFGPIDPQWYGTWRAMTHTFSATEIASITCESMASESTRFILDDYFLRTIDCGQCQELHSLSGRNSLWSFCNWEYMTLAIAPSSLRSFLSFEGKRPLKLLLSLTEAIESITYSQLIEEVFDMRSAQYKNWKKDDWLCTHCMIKLLSDNICAWLSERIRCSH